MAFHKLVTKPRINVPSKRDSAEIAFGEASEDLVAIHRGPPSRQKAFLKFVGAALRLCLIDDA